jgi:hypothetical protein
MTCNNETGNEMRPETKWTYPAGNWDGPKQYLSLPALTLVDAPNGLRRAGHQGLKSDASQARQTCKRE